MVRIRFPREIVIDILLRLPAKSLGRFRCVSWNWLTLFSVPKFIKTHLKSTNRNHIIFTDGSLLYSHPFKEEEEVVVLTPTKFRLETIVSRDGYYFCGSCDGLVLVSYFCSRKDSNMFLLYNPTTMEILELPASGYYNDYYDYYNEYRDWLYIETMEGFGYVSVANDYKVVTITYYTEAFWDSPNHVFVLVYSLRTNTWSLVVDSAYDYSYAGHSYETTGVFVNGFVHWITKKKSNGLQVIIAFSLADEIFSEVPWPDLCLSKNDCRLFVLGGKLAVFMEGEVWLMNEYGKTESWTKMLLHGLDEIQIDKPRVFDGNGRTLVADKDRMLVYDVEKRSFSKTVYVWNREKFTVEGTCVESLVSPKFTVTN